MQADTKISVAPAAVNTANAFTGWLNRGLAAKSLRVLFSPQLYYQENEMRKQPDRQ